MASIPAGPSGPLPRPCSSCPSPGDRRTPQPVAFLGTARDRPALCVRFVRPFTCCSTLTRVARRSSSRERERESQGKRGEEANLGAGTSSGKASGAPGACPPGSYRSVAAGGTPRGTERGSRGQGCWGVRVGEQEIPKQRKRGKKREKRKSWMATCAKRLEAKNSHCA